MNTTKTILVGIACGALFAGAAIVVTPLVHADTQDREFVNVLAEQDISPNESGIVWAHQICAHLDAGSTLNAEIEKVYTATNLSMTEYKSGYFVGAAIGVYCPWHDNLAAPASLHIA